jgi:hypothetical protein
MKQADELTPHGPGIADLAGQEDSQYCLTPPEIHEFKTEDVLEEPGVLKEGSSDQGATSESLGDASMSSLEDGYFKDAQNFDQENSGMLGYGFRPAADGRPVIEGKADQYIDKTKSPLDGFLGRTSLGQER